MRKWREEYMWDEETGECEEVEITDMKRVKEWRGRKVDEVNIRMWRIV